MYTVEKIQTQHGERWSVQDGIDSWAHFLNPEKARRIARALNRDVAMGEVREALEECAESLAVSLDRLGVCGEGDGKDRLADNDSWGGTDALNRARQALAALDAAGKGE